MEFLYRLDNVCHTMKYNENKDLLTVMLHDNASNVQDIIMGDPTVVTVNWLFINHTLQTYMGYALQIKLAYQYLVPKFGPNFDWCNHQLLEASLSDNDREYLEFLSSRQVKFNIQPYLTSIKDVFENTTFEIGNMFQRAVNEKDQDIIYDTYDNLFHNTFDQLLYDPDHYTQENNTFHPPAYNQQVYNQQVHKQQDVYASNDIDNQPSRKRMRGN